MGRDKQTQHKVPTIGDTLREASAADGFDLVGLLEKGAKGNKEAEARALDYLRRRPELADLVTKSTSDLKDTWLGFISGSGLTRFVLDRRMNQVRKDLLGDQPTALERLLVERVALCWLQVESAESMYVHKMEGGVTLKQGEFYDRLMERAQRRYLAAIKALAQVRRLQLPAVAQLNVATNQVNVAGAPPGQAAHSDAGQRALPDHGVHGVLTVDDLLATQETSRVARVRRQDT